MKDKKDDPFQLPDDYWKKLRDKNTPQVPPRSWEKLEIPEKLQRDVSFDRESGKFTFERADEVNSRASPVSSEGGLGCGLGLSLIWTAWTLYTAWPIVVSFNETGYEPIIKFVWILIAWGAPIALFFILGRSRN